MREQDDVNEYYDAYDRVFNFLGSLAEGYPLSSDEHNILKLACYAILFSRTRGAFEDFKAFLKESELSDEEQAYFTKLKIGL